MQVPGFMQAQVQYKTSQHLADPEMVIVKRWYMSVEGVEILTV